MNFGSELLFYLLISLCPLLCSRCNITPIISHVKCWVLKICEHFVNATSHAFDTKRAPASSLAKEFFFAGKHRATALQRGNSFPSCAWHIPLLHRDFSLAFALVFLDLTTFLRQIFWKIYSSDFLTTFYDNDFWFIPQQVQFSADSFLTSLFLHETFLRYDCRYS